MPSASVNKPSQGQLVLPLLEVLDEHGGAAPPAVVSAALAKRFGLGRDVLEETTEDSTGGRHNVWKRHVRYARLKAVQMGYVSGKGTAWALTQAGAAGLRSAAPVVLVRLSVAPDGAPLGAQIELAVGVPTVHTILQGDARDLGWLDSASIPLIVSSIPYFDLKNYGGDPGQLALLGSYEEFLAAMQEAMREHYRVLMPGGRLVYNVGDVLRSSARHGTHHVLPLHADLQVMGRRLGFEGLTGILWRKISNNDDVVLGQPEMPNQMIAQEVEHILVWRRPGPSRSTTPALRDASRITRAERAAWYHQVWDDVQGARSNQSHPCPFPVELPYRLIRMMSYAGDTVLDPFAGLARVAQAAMQAGRNSLSVELHEPYVLAGIREAKQQAAMLARAA